jgi:hypothetical protein
VVGQFDQFVNGAAQCEGVQGAHGHGLAVLLAHPVQDAHELPDLGPRDPGVRLVERLGQVRLEEMIRAAVARGAVGAGHPPPSIAGSTSPQ